MQARGWDFGVKERAPPKVPGDERFSGVAACGAIPSSNGGVEGDRCGEESGQRDGRWGEERSLRGYYRRQEYNISLPIPPKPISPQIRTHQPRADSKPGRVAACQGTVRSLEDFNDDYGARSVNEVTACVIAEVARDGQGVGRHIRVVPHEQEPCAVQLDHNSRCGGER